MEADANDQQARAVARLQSFLDAIAGSAGQSPEENKALASAVNQLADRFGVDLVCDGKAVSLRWEGGVFRARETSGDKVDLPTSAGFPKLGARGALHRAVRIGGGRRRWSFGGERGERERDEQKK